MIPNAADLAHVPAGEVLVTDKTDPDWEPIMKKAAAIVTNRGGRTCHAAIVSRELGVPAIVGTETGTDGARRRQVVTVSCAEGDTGFVYEGALPFDVERVDLSARRPAAHEDHDERRQPGRGVRAVVHPERRRRPRAPRVHHQQRRSASTRWRWCDYAQLGGQARADVDRLTAGYADKPAFFVDKLAEGVATIAAAFYPKDVIVRLSDFKTNEYARLAGGAGFEPHEENPMIGFRGASRYYDERYREGFALECRALKRVRDEMGLTNVKIMVPFCRTVEEARRVVRRAGAERARRGTRTGSSST